MAPKRVVWTNVGVGLLALVISGCGLLRDTPPAATPILITATPERPIVPIVATETPTVTPVLAATQINLLPTEDRVARTPTPSPPPPITLTPTFTPTATDTPATPGLAAVYGPVGGASGGASGICANSPAGAPGALYQSDPAIQAALGCPLSATPATASSAYQTFQNGLMVWVGSLEGQPQPTIYALFNNGTYQRFNDTFQDGVDPSSGGAAPPEGLIEPVRGFGKVWRSTSAVRDTLGWATSGETGGTAQVLFFERGEMLVLAQMGQTVILITGAPGTWTARAGGS